MRERCNLNGWFPWARSLVSAATSEDVVCAVQLRRCDILTLWSKPMPGPSARFPPAYGAPVEDGVIAVAPRHVRGHAADDHDGREQPHAAAPARRDRRDRCNQCDLYQRGHTAKLHQPDRG